MPLVHKNLARGAWHKLSLIEQLANIGSEISRARNWQNKDQGIFENAVLRALELFDLTLADPRWRGRLREIARTREVFLDALSGGKEYQSSLDDLDRYFLSFAYCARLNL
ncbi:MAG: hypothetical protein HYT98_02140 [Candidatus Sungbacteria bacterium]|nr:hypothetical protein [Candidatus Sungbacteria bacterium]